MSNDYMVRALSENGEVRAFAVTCRDLVEYAREIHQVSPVAIAALGRTLSAALMMGDMLKSKDDLVTVIIQGDGPLKQILATADMNGNVKGYVSVNDVDMPLKENGHLDVGSAVGNGKLTVIKDYGLKDPYVSSVDLVTGEIAEDITYYFAQSEQIPTVCGLGVLIDPDITISQAGGFIIQLMPHASEETISTIETNLESFASVTKLYSEGKRPEDLISIVMNGLNPVFTERKDVMFKCSCSYEKGENALLRLSEQELEEIIDSGEDQTVTCAFCNKTYTYTGEDIEKLLERKKGLH